MPCRWNPSNYDCQIKRSKQIPMKQINMMKDLSQWYHISSHVPWHAGPCHVEFSDSEQAPQCQPIHRLQQIFISQIETHSFAHLIKNLYPESP